MSFHDILAKPIQIVKEVLDLEPDLESPSLASQFVAIKHQLAHIQERLNESSRISREKDLVIAKLRKEMVAKAQPRPTAPAFVRHEEKPVQAPSVREPKPAAPVEAREANANRRYAPERAQVLQAKPDDEIKLPAVPSYQAAAPAKAEKARPTRTRVVAKETSAATPTAKAKPARGRVTAKKPSTAAEGKATPKKSTRTSKRATAEKAKPARTRATAKKTTAKTMAKTTAKPKRTSRASKR